MLQALIVVTPVSKFYTVSTVLFYKYGGENVGLKNCMSHVYMFVPIKANVKLANINTGHAQGIGIILCCFNNCPIIYPVGPGITVRVTLPTSYHQVVSNVMLVLKWLL